MECLNKACKKEPLKKMMIAGIQIDYCPKCLGMWFEKGELDSAKNNKDFALRWIDFDLWKNQKNFDAKLTEKKCPKDRSVLYCVKYQNSDIEIDVCNLCQGIWLERGEFDKLIDYLKAEDKKELMKNYSNVLSQELWEVFDGPKELREELTDLISVIKILQYKFIGENDWMKRFLMSLPKL